MINIKRKVFYFFVIVLFILIVFFLFFPFSTDQADYRSRVNSPNQSLNKNTITTEISTSKKELINNQKQSTTTNDLNTQIKPQEQISPIVKPEFTIKTTPPTFTQKVKTEVKDIIEIIKKPFVSEPVDLNQPPSKINLKIPFTSQAPFAEWDDPRQQDGCEEASLVMAWYWIQGKTLSKAEAKKEILGLYDAGVDLFGQSTDTSAEDTIKLFREYYNYDNIKLVYDITVQDIKDELLKGNALIIPTDGTILKNPYYVPPGPIRHMIVVVGYDDKKKEFITNDPGTRRGEGFRFSYDTVMNSIINYGSGSHEPLIDDRSVMIIVSK